MSGISAGPRQFPMMKTPCLVSGGEFKAGDDWESCSIAAGSRIIWNQGKMDLRAFDGVALDFSNIVIQEGSPLLFPSREGPVPVNMAVFDVFSTVPIIQNAEDARNLVGNFNTPGFLSMPDGVGSEDVPDRVLNPSQVIYGMWRVFAYSVDSGGVVPTVYNSSEFGTGEVVVAPEMYWTRYATIFDWDTEQNYFIPASNAMLSGIVYDISEGQELAQMARAVQR